MGIMACQRQDRDSIMCSKYSKKYGYICDVCFAELSRSNLSIDDFLKTSKEENMGINKNRLDELNKEYCL